MAADGEFERDDGVGISKSHFDVAIAFFEDVCLRRELILVDGRRFSCRNRRSHRLD
jgi:hypothetical protein